MTRNEFIQKMQREIDTYATGTRQQSASFLAWFLINYFRLDEELALDLICDSRNDKGIDGIYVDDINEEIYIFQSKYSASPGSDQGDNDLRNFIGAKSWFNSKENLSHLDNSFASNELKSLVKRLDVFDKFERNYEVYSIFITNKSFDYNAKDFLRVTGEYFDGWDLDKLYEQYIYTGKDKPVTDLFTFSFDASNSIKGTISGKYDYYIFRAKVNEIVKLKGIQDKTLFSKNVRYGLGRTRVNKDIRKTIQNAVEHKNVILYHNGITIICENIQEFDNSLKISNYSVVNGCQSTVTFYENQSYLSDDLEVLLKVIKTGEEEKLGKDVTYFTNNQNAISLQDLKSNDKIQQYLQQEFLTLFGNKVLYRIKRGENEAGYETIIPNDFAAQLITAFYLKEPHTTHQKSEIFAENYNNIFNRKINAAYIYLLYQMYLAIESRIGLVEDEGIRTYKTTRFFFLYVLRLILEQDSLGNELINNPSGFLEKYNDHLVEKFSSLFESIVFDFNYMVNEIKQQSGFFDYKNELRNASRVQDMAGRLGVDYKKYISRHQEASFQHLITK